MIHRIESSLPTFKTLTFKPGLNVLEATRVETSSERQTRNGAGKSSFVELVHFLTGANVGAESIFRGKELEAHRFMMSFDLGGQIVRAGRSGARPSRIQIEASDSSRWPVQPDSAGTLSNNDWKTDLGNLFFGLSPEANLPNHPGFRSIFSYFCRREAEGGFSEMSTFGADQQIWDQQVNLTYLLGLDWSAPQRLEHIRRQDRALRTLRSAVKEGALGEFITKASELKTQLVLAEEKTLGVRNTLSSFKVFERYRDFEAEADRLTREIGTLSDENTSDRQFISSMTAALNDEEVKDERPLDRVIEEVGSVLKDVAVERLSAVYKFHRSVIANRRTYLAAEIEMANRRIADREGRNASLDGRRSEIMCVLQAKGALEQFQSLQRELNQLEAHVMTLRSRYAAAKQLESRKVDLGIERSQVEQRLRANLDEQSGLVDKAIRTFESISKALYEDAGYLTLAPTSNGLKVEVQIQGQRSKGIRTMQVFCFDMMLMRLAVERGFGPGFVIHDSHIFDGVDERQVARAIEVGRAQAESVGWQYIVSMNSDAVPTSLKAKTWFNDAVLPVTLTDAREDGGLFGIRF